MLTLCKIPIHLETATDAVKGFQERLVLITLQCINSFKAAPPPPKHPIEILNSFPRYVYWSHGER